MALSFWQVSNHARDEWRELAHARQRIARTYPRSIVQPAPQGFAPAGDCFSRIVSVLEGILVTLWGARRHPPCIRQGPFGIAADRQRLPLLVRARSRCASATVGGLELFGRPSPIIRLRPGSKECEVSKFCAALLPQLMFVCLLARLRAEPKHPLPMHNQTKLTVAVIAVSHNRSSGFLNEETPVPYSSPRVLS